MARGSPGPVIKKFLVCSGLKRGEVFSGPDCAGDVFFSFFQVFTLVHKGLAIDKCLEQCATSVIFPACNFDFVSVVFFGYRVCVNYIFHFVPRVVVVCCRHHV